MSFLEKGKKNERKALIRLLEIEGPFDKDELGFGVKLKKDNGQFFVITSSSVLRSPLSLPGSTKVVADRFCSRYPEHREEKDHRLQVLKVIPSVDENISFAFCEGGREDEFLEVDDGTIQKTLQIMKTLHAFVFEEKEIIDLKFDYEHSQKEFTLIDVSKKGFQFKKAKGAPIIAYDPYSEQPKVLGVVGTQSDGQLHPVFLTENNLSIDFGTNNNATSEKGKIPTHSDEVKQNLENMPLDETDKAICPTDLEENKPLDEAGKAIYPTDLEVAKGTVTVVTGMKQKDNYYNKVATSWPRLDPTTYFLSVGYPESIFKHESKCIKYMTIGEALPNTLKMSLQMKLDPDRPLGGDVSSLAGAFGYKSEKITYLRSREYPTQTLLQQEAGCTMMELRGKLKEIERDDAVKDMDDYIKNNCDCEKCENLR